MPLAFTTQSLPGLSTVELEDIKVGPDTDCLLDDTLSETARLERMMAWLAQGQGKVGHVEFKTYEDEYRGVHAARNVPNNVILLEVPMNYIMTTDLCKASRLGRRIDTSGVKLMTSHTYVAALLVQERFNPTSFWKPYISILPRTFKTMPLHFQDCEIDELEGSLVLPRLEQQRRNLLHEYNNICKHVPAFQLFSLELFTWARLCVLSRIFGFTVKSYKTDGIVPLADMLNHKSVHQTLWNFDTKRNSFTITTLEQINKGDPVFDSYGRKCNSRFLLNYGFALEDNSDNEAAFEVKLEPGEPFFAAKMRLLGSAARKFNLTASCSDFASKECFSFLRIAVAHNEEMLLLAGAFGLDVCNVKPLSLANELRVLAVLRAIAEQALARFTCSIAQDELLLPHAKGNLRNIIIMRLGEKRVYKWFVALHGLVEAVIGGPSLSSNSKGGEIWPALERVAGDVVLLPSS
jgi:histone-lysine N-methyltransferase SETD3